MAKTTFRYNIPKKSVGGFTVDAFISENYTFSNSATEIPIENGVTITDNIVEEPDEIQIEGFVGSIEFESNNSVNENTINGLIPITNTRRDRAYNELVKLMKDKEAITITTGLSVYDNMVITSLEIPRDVNNGKDLHFTMTLRKLQMISSETVKVSINRISSSAGDAGSTIQSTSETGQQTKQQVEEENILKEVWDAKLKNGEISQDRYNQAQSMGWLKSMNIF